MKRKLLWLCCFAILGSLIRPVEAAAVPSSWAQSGVLQAQELGLIPQELQAQYDAPITRGEFCQVLALWLKRCQEQALLLQPLSNASISFLDTDDPQVLALAGLGIVNGTGGGLFQPQALITRQEAACMIHRAALLIAGADGTLCPTALPHVFQDGAALSPWARASVNWTYRTGLLQGVNKDAFAPLSHYTREQTYLTVLRLYKLAKDGASGVTPPEDYYLWEGGYVNSAGSFVTDYPQDAAGIARYALRGRAICGAYGEVLFELDEPEMWRGSVQFYGDIAAIQGASEPYLLNLKTLQVLHNTELQDYGDGVIRYFQMGSDWYYGYLCDDGSVLNPNRYRCAGNYLDGQAIVQNFDGSFALLDKAGTVLQRLDLDPSLALHQAYGATAVVTDETSFGLYLAGKGLLTPIDRINGTVFSNGQAELCSRYLYTLYDTDGSVVIPEQQYNNLEIGKGLYLHLVRDTTYTLYSAAGKNLATLQFYQNSPWVKADGGGLLAYRSGKTTCTVMDVQGNVLSVIDTGRELDWSGSGFYNGLLYLSSPESGDDGATSAYLPESGTQIHLPA